MNSLLEYYRKKEDIETNNIIFEKVKEEDIKICGRTIKEIINILNGLTLERTLNIQMTMENLDILFKTLMEKDKHAFEEYIKCQLKEITNE